MFVKWLSEHDVSTVSFENRLFPPVSDRAFWQSVLDDTHIQNAEEYLHYEWPLIRATQFMEFQKSGDRLAQETPHFARRDALCALVIGEIAENSGRFLADICDGIFAICEETYWGLSAHPPITRPKSLVPDAADPYIDLFAAETAELLAVTYHILYGALYAYCPEIVSRIEYEMDRRIVTPYLTHGDYWWMGYLDNSVNNWNPWIISNILTVFLTLDLRRADLNAGLKKMFIEINRYYACMPADGGCDEGATYWKVAGGKLLSFCDQLFVASDGKVNFFEDEKLHRIGQYEIKAYIGGCYFVNFADGNTLFQNDSLDYELYAFGLRTGDRSFCRFAATLKREQSKIRTKEAKLIRSGSIKSALYGFIYQKDIDAQPDFVPEESYLLLHLQCAFMRAGDWYYAAKGGHNAESHNHNDVGNCIVYHEGKPVLVDAGCGVYTRFTFDDKTRYKIWTMQSGWHNLPVFNGAEQVAGGRYRADSFMAHGKKTTVSFAGAYPAEAGVTQAVREIDMTDAGVTIRDTAVFEKDTNTVEVHFITPLTPAITPDGVVLGGKYLLKTSLPCQTEWKDFEGDNKLRASWGAEGLYRIVLSARCEKAVTITTEVGCI